MTELGEAEAAEGGATPSEVKEAEGGTTPPEITVVVVDDSLVCREMLSEILSSDPEIKVVGMGRDGGEAIELVKQLRPSLVTMDIHMPKMDGIGATEEIMAFCPTPILIVSSSVRPDQTGPAFDALKAGALDVLKKPEPKDWSELEHIGVELIAKVKMLARVHVVTHVRGRIRDRAQRARPTLSGPRTLLAIGSSTGGPAALVAVLSKLPEDFRPAVVVAQHIADGFVPGLVEWLGTLCKLPVVQARNGQDLVGGAILVAPTGGHLAVRSGCVETVEAEAGDVYRPSCNVLFESAAKSQGAKTIGVILTGMGADGAKGLKALHDAGGYTIAQDERTSVIFGMPKAAIEIGAVDVVSPIDLIADEIMSGLEVGAPDVV
jgi:two-component system, chemotaxis family, protein-glutamate methylesterase/glutaminase